MRDWILPLGREGSLGRHDVPYVLLAMEKQLPPERIVLCIQHSCMQRMLLAAYVRRLHRLLWP